MRSSHEARAMPYLQLDVPDRYPIDVKRNLARRLGEIYSRLLQTSPDMVTVAFREMDEGGVWRCSDGEPEPAAQLMCDIRSGRPPGQRAELAQGHHVRERNARSGASDLDHTHTWKRLPGMGGARRITAAAQCCRGDQGQCNDDLGVLG